MEGEKLYFLEDGKMHQTNDRQNKAIRNLRKALALIEKAKGSNVYSDFQQMNYINWIKIEMRLYL